MKLNAIKKQWKIIIKEMHLMDGERLRFHGTRKGFASSLLQYGLPLSWISYAGRWKLQAYLIHSQKDLLGLCLIFMYGKIVTKVEIDFDKSEFDLVKDLNNLSAVSKKRLSTDYRLTRVFRVLTLIIVLKGFRDGLFRVYILRLSSVL